MANTAEQLATLAPILVETHAAFRYVVDIEGVPVGAFTECTLPVLELETKEVREGGLNTYVHLLPGPRKQAQLTLKNGVGKNALVDWCIKTMSETFAPKSITVTLRDARTVAPVCTWKIHNAYPTKWTGPQLQSDSNAIAIQTVEFACGYVEIEFGEPIVD